MCLIAWFPFSLSSHISHFCTNYFGNVNSWWNCVDGVFFFLPSSSICPRRKRRVDIRRATTSTEHKHSDFKAIITNECSPHNSAHMKWKWLCREQWRKKDERCLSTPPVVRSLTTVCAKVNEQEKSFAQIKRREFVKLIYLWKLCEFYTRDHKQQQRNMPNVLLARC